MSKDYSCCLVSVWVWVCLRVYCVNCMCVFVCVCACSCGLYTKNVSCVGLRVEIHLFSSFIIPMWRTVSILYLLTCCLIAWKLHHQESDSLNYKCHLLKTVIANQILHDFILDQSISNVRYHLRQSPKFKTSL